jgi:hypothetical protein
MPPARRIAKPGILNRTERSFRHSAHLSERSDNRPPVGNCGTTATRKIAQLVWQILFRARIMFAAATAREIAARCLSGLRASKRRPGAPANPHRDPGPAAGRLRIVSEAVCNSHAAPLTLPIQSGGQSGVQSEGNGKVGGCFREKARCRSAAQTLRDADVFAAASQL